MKTLAPSEILALQSHGTQVLVRNADSQTPPQSLLSAAPQVTHMHFRVGNTGSSRGLCCE